MTQPHLTPTMKETLISMLTHATYPTDRNNSQTFHTLEHHGLIQPTIDNTWALTSHGRTIALKLRKH